MAAQRMRDKSIVVSAASERGRTAGLEIFAERLHRGRTRPVEIPMPLICLGGAKTCVFPDFAVVCLILLRGRQACSNLVRL
jgi:hypothetical protein